MEAHNELERTYFRKNPRNNAKISAREQPGQQKPQQIQVMELASFMLPTF
jgi:hypothetical protein